MSRINTNVSSLIAQKTLSRSNAQLQVALNRLSTGLRINSGKDDPAGLIASENLRRDITATERAISNTERANQLIATADSALGQVSSLLNDIRGLVTEAANGGVLSDEQITANQLQVDSSLEAIDRIAQVTTFQGRKLLDGNLDFLTNISVGASSISDLNIQQANLGAAGSINVSVDITTAATRALITNTGGVNFSAGTAASGTVTFPAVTTPATQAAGNVTLTNSSAVINVQAVAGAAADGTVGNATDVVTQGASDIAHATGTLNLTNTTGSISISAVAGGAAQGAIGNGVAIVLQSGATTAATYNSGTNTITVDVAAGDDVDDIAGVINGLAAFNATTASGGTNAYNASDNGTVNSALSGGSNGTTSAAYNSGTNVITVQVALNETVSNIASAINGLAAFNASATSGGGNTYNVSDHSTYNNPLTGGANAVTTNDVITITSNNTGTAYNGTLTFATSGSVAANTVDVQLSGANITVTVNNASTYAVSDLVTAIQSQLTGYTVTQSGSAGDGSFVAASDTATTANLTGGVNDTGTGLAADVVFKLTGSSGSEVFSFSSGTALQQIIDSVNLVSDATGVSASRSGSTLQLQSTAYGSAAFVDVEVLTEGSGGQFGTNLSATRDAGSDIVATVNGTQANGNGNRLSINTATLDLDLTVNDGSSTDLAFTITGGGAVFQLGPDVVSNQQARIGIGSVNTGVLGGSTGRLFELRSGSSRDLKTDATGAARIVDQAITKVTQLRGRLGAFQRTTLDSNIATLGDTLANLSEAESAIRDADFAAESARLTRAQILVQSGTAVLTIANQNPQNVLSLLR